MLSNRRRAKWTVGSFVITAAVAASQPQQGKPAEPQVAAANRSVQSRLPFQAIEQGDLTTTGDAKVVLKFWVLLVDFRTGFSIVEPLN